MNFKLWPITADINDLRHLRVGGCDVVELAASHGTPLYVIDELTVRQSCDRYRTALTQYYPARHSVHYACKALLNTAVAQLIDEAGFGFDVVSSGELHIACNAGVSPDRIHFQGNAKTLSELAYAVDSGVARVVVDNHDELLRLRTIARAANRRVEISLRVVPDVVAGTHAHIQTGHAHSKFGFSLECVDAVVESLQDADYLHLSGLHFHLGSQIFDLEPYERALDVLLYLASRLRRQFGIDITELSPGGGLATGYVDSEPSAAIESFVQTVAGCVVRGCRERGLPLPHLVLEPGRSIVAQAGVALYEIVGSKPLPRGAGARRYLHVDGGMADNIRPALYGAQYVAQLANRMAEPGDDVVHLSGRYCESSDILIRGLELAASAATGDIVAVPMSGAYTLSMSSNYNGAQRPAVVLVANGSARLIQRRESLADLVSRDLVLRSSTAAGMT